jgi:uncharacterized protein YdeI (YjbR/CyaY-like superfamily)
MHLEMTIESFIESAPNGYGPHVVIDYDAAKAFIALHKNRVIVYGPDNVGLHRALQLRKDGYALIMLSKEVLKMWRSEIGDLVNLRIEPDTSEYGMAFPEEFKIVLEQDLEAAAAFTDLNPGRKRGLLYYAASAKTEQTRIKRALELAKKLRTGTLYGGGF